jgi:Family of unknown function (DUF6594)
MSRGFCTANEAIALALRDYETLSQEAVAELVPQNRGVLWALSFKQIKKSLYRALNRQPAVDQPPVEKSDAEVLDAEDLGEEDELEEEEGLEEEEHDAEPSKGRFSDLPHPYKEKEPTTHGRTFKETLLKSGPKQKKVNTLEDLFKVKNAKNNFREVDKTAREAREMHKASSERLWMGSFGGLALIVPMLIMVLHRSLHGSLIVSSIGTVLFAFALALAARTLRGMDVLAATAAYAAVLVVFVGTSLPPLS